MVVWELKPNLSRGGFRDGPHRPNGYDAPRHPALKSFDFAIVNGKLLIVDPSDKKIVAAIGG